MHDVFEISSVIYWSCYQVVPVDLIHICDVLSGVSELVYIRTVGLNYWINLVCGYPVCIGRNVNTQIDHRLSTILIQFLDLQIGGYNNKYYTC